MSDRDMAMAMPEWEPETFIARVEKCRVMLAVHGFLPDAENARVKARIKKAFDRYLRRKESHD